MDKKIGSVIVALSFLTLSIVISINNMSITIKEIAAGNFSYHSAISELSIIEYSPIILSILIGVILIIKSKEE